MGRDIPTHSTWKPQALHDEWTFIFILEFESQSANQLALAYTLMSTSNYRLCVYITIFGSVCSNTKHNIASHGADVINTSFGFVWMTNRFSHWLVYVVHIANVVYFINYIPLVNGCDRSVAKSVIPRRGMVPYHALFNSLRPRDAFMRR